MRAQVRLWFYSLLFMGVTLEGASPYRSVLAYGDVRDEKGEVMHKSKGNAILVDDAVEKMGADVMRWMYAKEDPGSGIDFGYTPAKEVQKTINVLYNTINYIKTYCEASNFQPKRAEPKGVASRWLVSRIETLKKGVTESMEGLDYCLAARMMENFFVFDLSRWYIHSNQVRSEGGEIEREGRGPEYPVLYCAGPHEDPGAIHPVPHGAPVPRVLQEV